MRITPSCFNGAAGTQTNLGVKASGSLDSDGLSDTVSYQAGVSGGILTTLAKDIPALVPLIDAIAHVNGTYNSPSVDDIVTIYNSLMKCDGVDSCLLAASEAVLGNCGYFGTDFTNCPEVMEEASFLPCCALMSSVVFMSAFGCLQPTSKLSSSCTPYAHARSTRALGAVLCKAWSAFACTRC